MPPYNAGAALPLHNPHGTEPHLLLLLLPPPLLLHFPAIPLVNSRPLLATTPQQTLATKGATDAYSPKVVDSPSPVVRSPSPCSHRVVMHAPTSAACCTFQQMASSKPRRSERVASSTTVAPPRVGGKHKGKLGHMLGHMYL